MKKEPVNNFTESTQERNDDNRETPQIKEVDPEKQIHSSIMQNERQINLLGNKLSDKKLPTVRQKTQNWHQQ